MMPSKKVNLVCLVLVGMFLYPVVTSELSRTPRDEESQNGTSVSSSMDENENSTLDYMNMNMNMNMSMNMNSTLDYYDWDYYDWDYYDSVVEDTPSLKVFDFSLDSDNAADSSGAYTHASLEKDDLPPSLTICSAYFIESWLSTTTSADMFTMVNHQGNIWSRALLFAAQDHTQYQVQFGPARLVSKVPKQYFPLQWIRLCASLDTDAGKARVVVDGVLLGEQEYKVEDDVNRPDRLFIATGYFNSAGFIEEYTGRVSNLNIFSSALSIEQMVAMTTAGGEECGATGDYLNWEEDEWTLHSAARMLEVGMPGWDARMLEVYEGPCRRESKIHAFPMVLFHYHKGCMQHCQKIGGGRSPPVGTWEQWKALETELDAITPDITALPRPWLAGTEGDNEMKLEKLSFWPSTEKVDNLTLKLEAEEGVWRDYYTGERLEHFLPWYPGHDARYGEDWNCLVVYTDQPAWGKFVFEWTCSSYDKSCLCEYERQPLVSLQGFCKKYYESYVGDFTPKQLPGDPTHILLVDTQNTRIEYDDTTSQWIMEDWKTGLTATTKASANSYALGKHTWEVTNDVFGCNGGQPYSTKLKLTGCDTAVEFTCDDGQCITMEQRCDQLPNCRDKSDEASCNLLVLEGSYNMKVPPISAVSDVDFTVVPVTVQVSIVLMKIIKMEEVEHKIDLKFQISLEWKDNRAKYYNLKAKASLNSLTDEEIQQLWLPDVLYDNTDQTESTKLGDWKTSITVSKEGNSSRSSKEEVDEKQVFQGADNGLNMQQTYTHNFQCEYMLHRYPFDTQECSIEMTVPSINLDTVMLVPHRLAMRERVDMTLYTITEWSLVHRNTSNLQEGVRMMLRLQRKMMNEMMTTYLPSVLLILITWATTFFKPYFFEAALSVNLTTMLVMTTIFISVMQMLPATAYVKMIDVWLIFGQLVPFLEVILLTAMEYVREGDGSGEEELTSQKTDDDQTDSDGVDADKQRGEKQMYWLKMTEKKILPVLVVIFTLIYVSISVMFYFRYI